MSKTNNTATINTPLGDAEAQRDADGVWEVNYPWGAARFHGTKTQVLALMRRALGEVEPDWRFD